MAAACTAAMAMACQYLLPGPLWLCRRSRRERVECLCGATSEEGYEGGAAPGATAKFINTLLAACYMRVS